MDRLHLMENIINVLISPLNGPIELTSLHNIISWYPRNSSKAHQMIQEVETKVQGM